MTSEEKFPKTLRIRNTEIYDDLGGAGQRIYTTAGQGYEKVGYVRADLIEGMLEKQREACLNRSLNNLTDIAFTAAEAVEDGCLNATDHGFTQTD